MLEPPEPPPVHATDPLPCTICTMQNLMLHVDRAKLPKGEKTKPEMLDNVRKILQLYFDSLQQHISNVCIFTTTILDFEGGD